MEEPTNPLTYRFGDNKVEILPYFLYEVSIYKVERNMAGLIASRFYKSDKLLAISKDIIIKRYKDYSIIRYTSVLGVTKEFVEENNLPIYEITSKRKRNQEKKKKKK